MVSMREIRELAREIERAFQPERIILFGSYAYGRPRPDSDVDLLVIMPFDGSGPQQALEILERVDPPFGVDLLVRTPAEVEERVAWNDFFLKEIMQQGKVLYEASHVRVG